VPKEGAAIVRNPSMNLLCPECRQTLPYRAMEGLLVIREQSGFGHP
jgi:hypothetical protein